MLCEECKTNEATCMVSVMAGDEVTTRHLCSDCVAKLNANFQNGNIRNLLSSIMSAITGGIPTPAGKVELTCPRCQTTLSQFRATGHLGCPKCYGVFREQLQPMLQQIHGRVQHAGRKPLDTEEAKELRRQREELTLQMEAAVAAEDFERAALVRDQLRAITGGGDRHEV